MKWVKVTTRECDILTYACNIFGYIKEYHNYIGRNFKNFLLISKNGISSSYRQEDEYQEILKTIRRQGIRKLGIILDRLEISNQKLKKYLSIKNLSHYSDHDLLALIQDFLQVYQEYFPQFLLPKTYGLVFNQEEIPKAIAKKLNRLRRVAYYEQIQDIFFPVLFKEISKRKNIETEFLFATLPDELLSFFSEKKVKVNNKILQKRKKYCLILVKNSKMQIFFGKKAEKQEKKELKPDSQASSVIIGKVAYQGKVKGRVKTVIRFSDLKGTKDKVIVTPMTSIRFVPFLNKVKAIITDEGGIACHAAIISREIKIPCITGTKIATQVLKDGDLVEVDANKGIVRKL